MHAIAPLVVLILGLAVTRPARAQTCQELSDTYAIVHGVSFGTAAPDIQDRWRASGCNTRPSAARIPSLCQELSDASWIIHGASWGTASVAVQKAWTAIGCGATPTVLALGAPTRIINAAPPTLCLNVVGAEAKTPGALADLAACDTPGSGLAGFARDALWTPRATDGGFVQLVSGVDPSLCLGVQGVDAHGNGARVEVYPCAANPHRDSHWRIEAQVDRTARLVNRASGRCLGVSGVDQPRVGARIEVYDCAATPNRDMRWSRLDTRVVGTWLTGAWSACLERKRTRTVECRDASGGVVAAAACTDARPPDEQACGVATFEAGPWSVCVDGTQTRTVTCLVDGVATTGKVCNQTTMPPSSQACSADWVATPWSACQAGAQTRTVSCRDASGAPAPESACTASRPTTTQPCTVGWVVGPWGPCDKGTQTRDVSCRDSGGALAPAASCTAARPEPNQACTAP